jgi:hypothetical protein
MDDGLLRYLTKIWGELEVHLVDELSFQMDRCNLSKSSPEAPRTGKKKNNVASSEYLAGPIRHVLAMFGWVPHHPRMTCPLVADRGDGLMGSCNCVEQEVGKRRQGMVFS